MPFGRRSKTHVDEARLTLRKMRPCELVFARCPSSEIIMSYDTGEVMGCSQNKLQQLWSEVGLSFLVTEWWEGSHTVCTFCELMQLDEKCMNNVHGLNLTLVAERRIKQKKASSPEVLRMN